MDRDPTPELDARALRLVAELVELEGAARTTALDAACAGDDALRARVLALLRHDASDSDAFADGAAWIGADLLDAGDDRDALLPERIGGFRIVRKLGQGGMGVVYEGEQSSPRRRVAIKVLGAHMATVERVRRFEREQEALARLQHPGIATILQTGTALTPAGERPWFAMELVDGAPITTHAARERLDVGARLALLAELADAVQHAHEHGIVHRDLKPDNVLVSREGRVKVLDFGVARVSEPSSVLQTLVTQTGALVGTLAYMAPEQVDVDSAPIGPAADVYALGVIAYELLTGRRPHELAGLPLQVAARLIAERDAPRLGELDSNLRGDIETIVGKALAKEPERRYASAAMFSADLRRVLTHEPIAARPPTLGYRVRRFTRRHRGLVGSSVVLAFVAAVAVGLAFEANRQTDLADRRLAETEAQRAAADSARRVAEWEVFRGNLLAASVSLEDADGGSEAARATLAEIPEARRGWEWRHLMARTEPRYREVALGAGHSANHSLSVGHERLLAAHTWNDADAGRGRVVVWNPVTDEPVDVAELDGVQFSDTAFRPGDRELVAVGRTLGQAPRHWIGIRDIEAGVWTEQRTPMPLASDEGTSSSLTSDGAQALFDSAVSPLYDVGEAGVVGQLGWRMDWSDALIDHTRLVHDHGGTKLFDIRDGSLVTRLARSAVRGGAYMGDGGTTLVDLSTGQPVELGPAPWVSADVIRSAALSPDRRWLAWAHPGTEALRVQDARTGEVAATLGTVRGGSDGLTFLADGQTLVSGGRASSVRVWDRPLDDPAVLRGHETFVYAVDVWEPGGLLVSADYGGGLRLWDLASGAPVASWSTGPRVSQELVVFGDRPLLAHGNYDTGARVYDLEHGRLAWRAARPVKFVAPSPDGSRLAITHNHVLRVYDALSGEQLVERSVGHESVSWEYLWPVTWHPDGTRLFVSLGGAHAVGEYSAHTLELLSTSDLGTETTRLEFDPTDGSLAFTHHNGLSFLGVDGDEGRAPWPHDSELLVVAWSPDGTRVATGSNDHDLRLWDAARGKLVAQLEGHDDYIKDLVWTADGQTLFSASGDRTVRVWSARPLRERSRALARWHLVAERLRPEVERRFAEDVAAGRTTDVPVAERVADLGMTARERQIAAQLLLGLRLEATAEG